MKKDESKSSDGVNENVDDVDVEITKSPDNKTEEISPKNERTSTIPWGVILGVSCLVIILLFIAEKNPIGEVAPKTVAKFNAIGHVPVASDLIVADTGDAYAITDKDGNKETWSKKSTFEWKDDSAVINDSKVSATSSKTIAKIEVKKVNKKSSVASVASNKVTKDDPKAKVDAAIKATIKAKVDKVVKSETATTGSTDPHAGEKIKAVVKTSAPVNDVSVGPITIKK